MNRILDVTWRTVLPLVYATVYAYCYIATHIFALVCPVAVNSSHILSSVGNHIIQLLASVPVS